VIVRFVDIGEIWNCCTSQSFLSNKYRTYH